MAEGVLAMPGYGTGESDLRNPISKQHYFHLCTEDMVALITEESCKYYNLDCPPGGIVMKAGNQRHFSGTFYPATNSIILRPAYLGILLHELAHYVVRCVYGKVKSNGHYVHHGVQFYGTLQELHNLWREVQL